MIPNVFANIDEAFQEVYGVSAQPYTNARILVVTGDNAAGKSFLRRIFSQILRKDYGIESIHLSQEGRATGGFQRAVVYGDEETQSTGVITCGTFISGIRTSKARTKPHVIIWDEPEIGLGEEAQLGAVNYLIDNLLSQPTENLTGAIFMTHSRIFATELMKLQDARFLNVGGKHPTLETWLNRELKPLSPEEIRANGHAMYARIQAVLNKVQESKVSSVNT